MDNKPTVEGKAALFADAEQHVSWWSHPRFAQLRPMLIDTAIPIMCYYVLHSWLGLPAILALTVAVVLLSARVLFTVVHERKIDAYQSLILVAAVASLVLAALAGDARFALLRPSIVSAVLGLGCVATAFVGKPLVAMLVRPGLALGFPHLAHAWEQCWDTDPKFRTAVRQLNLVYAIGFLAGAFARAYVVLHTSLEAGLFTSWLPGAGIGVFSAVFTAILFRPIIAALESATASHEAKEPRAVPQSAEVQA